LESLTIHIVEDEIIIAMDIEEMLETMEHRVESISTNYQQFIEKLPTDNSDLFLVDINLKGEGSGIDVAQELSKKNIPHIYISSHTDENILKNAKTTNAYGYVIKPFVFQDLYVAIEMAKGRLRKENANQTALINDGHGKWKVQLNDILYAEADGNYTHIHTLEKKFTLRNNLKGIHGSILKDAMFQRVHKSYVVNTNRIEKAIKNLLILKNGKQIPVGKKCEEESK